LTSPIRKKFDRNGLRRDSHGFVASAGLVIADDAVWSGEIAATIETRDYADSALDTEVAPGLAANLQWRPTTLTRIDLSSGVALNETSSATDGATRSWTAGATFTHALRDNLDLIGGLSGSVSEASSGTDVAVNTRAGLEWKFNPLLALSAAYEGAWLFADDASDDYDEQRVVASIIMRR
jgi:hypothetical protein